MKTTNNSLRKAGMELLTITAVFFAACFTISAQGGKYEYISGNYEQLASVENFKSTKTIDAITGTSVEMEFLVKALIKDYESDLSIENWMIDVTYFVDAKIETEIEELLHLEDWMINSDNFIPKKTENQLTGQLSEIDDNISKATGMPYSRIQFGRRELILKEMKDPKLEMENWMTDKGVWNVNM